MARPGHRYQSAELAVSIGNRRVIFRGVQPAMSAVDTHRFQAYVSHSRIQNGGGVPLQRFNSSFRSSLISSVCLNSGEYNRINASAKLLLFVD